jgi:hypothetical protein
VALAEWKHMWLSEGWELLAGIDASVSERDRTRPWLLWHSLLVATYLGTIRAGRYDPTMLVRQAFRYELDPTAVQRAALANHAGAARWAWSCGLSVRRKPTAVGARR